MVAGALLGLVALGCGGQSAQLPSEVPPIAAQRSPAGDELHALVGALDALLNDGERAPSTGPLAAGLRQARIDVIWLERRAASWPSTPAVEAFVAAMSGHRQLLAQAGRAPAAEAAPLIDVVVRDLAIKARQCRTFGGPIPVDVHVVTRDTANREVSGYEVWYVRKAYERDPAAFRRFEQNSSPAAHLFNEAGYYVLWVDQASASDRRRRGVPFDLEVGPDRLRQVVDLVVPAADDDAAGAASASAP